jgi:hypothetical protein
MEFVGLAFLFVVLGIVIGYIFHQYYGGNAPGLAPDNTPKQASGTYYEIKGVCLNLERQDISGQPTNKYWGFVYEEATINKLYTIRNTKVKGLPAGTTVRLTYEHNKKFSHPSPYKRIVSQKDLADGDDTTEFNGAAGTLPQATNRADVIYWLGELTLPAGTTQLPERFEVCTDLKYEA